MCCMMVNAKRTSANVIMPMGHGPMDFNVDLCRPTGFPYVGMDSIDIDSIGSGAVSARKYGTGS